MVNWCLCRVYIENKPYEELIPRYDRSGTFFYIDPPYYNCESYYGKDIFDRWVVMHKSTVSTFEIMPPYKTRGQALYAELKIEGTRKTQ
jgi:site-specific DNA-adenine methylase